MRELDYPRLGERVRRQTLPSGLELIVVERPAHARSYALFAARYGGMDLRFRWEGAWRDTPAGVAHYLEHKLFDTPTGSASQQLARYGAVDNAFTSNAVTAYYFQCTRDFYECLRILLSFVSQPWFTQESVDKERGIIAQEIRMVDDDPDWQVYARLMECLYRRSPVRLPVAGTVESIQAVTPQLLYDCHRAFYTPGNMALVCVGGMELERVAELAMELLPSGGGPAPERDYGPEEDLLPIRRETAAEMEVSMPMFLAGFKCSPPAGGEALLRSTIIGDLACDALFGDSSPLYVRLYREGAVNGSLGGGFDALPGAAYVYAGGDARDPDYVCEAILDQAQRLGREGLEEEFYQRLRRAAYGSMLRSLNSLEDVAVSMAEGYFRGFDYYRFPEVFDTVTKADVEAFLRENITRERMAVSVIRPKTL